MSVFTKEQQAQIDSLTSDKTTAAAGTTGASGKSASTFDRLLNQESGGSQFNDDGSVKTSKKGAIGIAQVMPATGPEAAKLAGLPWDENRYRKDPEYNKALGRAYFEEQLRTFGDERTALAAYNAGPGATARAIARAKREGGDFLAYLPEETRKYVPAIMGGKFSAKPLPSSPEGRAMGGSTAWSQQPRYQDPGFNAAFEREALLDAADESPVSTSLGRGWEGLKHNAGLFLDNVTDDSQGAAERIKAKRQWDEQNPAPRSSQGFVEDWQRLAEDDYAGMFATFAKNPGGALNQMVEQTPNSLPALAIQIPVGIASSALYATGVGAPIAMGLQAVASFVGNVLPEGGAIIEEQLAKSGINPNDTAAVAKWIAENRGANLEAGIKKAGGISLVDGATGYLAGKLIAGPSIRFAQAEAQVLAKAGVNTTDKAAIAAARATPAYKQAMAAPAKDLLDATTRAQKIVREVGGFSLEAAGEGVGEYAGSYAANGEASVKDAILEGAMGAGTSAAMTGANTALGSAKGPDMDRAALEALAATPVQPVIKPNSPLSNAAEIARAAQPAPTDQPDPVQVDPFAERLTAMQSFVEDKAFIQALRGSQGYGPESVTEALSAFAKARNPNLDPKIRERALADLETFVQGFSNRPNFVFGQNTPEQATPPGQQVATINPQGGAVAPATPRDDGRTLNGEVITRPEKMAGANPNQLSAPPVLGLPTEQALNAKRDADAAYEQAYQDLVKAEQLGESDAQIMARQQAIRDAREAQEQADARLKEIEQTIDGNRQQQTAEKRRAVLDAILADPATANPAARLAAELKRQGFRDTTPTQAELDTIQRFSDIKNAEAEPDIIPSSPNELDPYQVRQERPQQPAKPRLTVEQIKQAIANGATLSKDVLTLPDGARVKLKGPQIAAAREAMRKAAPQAEKVVQESRDDLIDRYKQAEPFSDEEYEIYEQLTQLTVEAIEAKLDAGSVPVFDTGRDTFVAVTPSAQQPGKIQVTRYNKDGVFGDTQYDAMKRAVIDNDLYRHRALTPEEAESRFAESLQAEAEYQARKSQAEAPAQPAETPDVSTRTDDQLQYLANNGKPGWKEAAQAEMARREGAKPAEFEHRGVRIYPANVSIAGERKQMWGVESSANKAKREAGERHGFGDSLHETREQAIDAADRQIREDRERAEYDRRMEEIAAKKRADDAARKADTINGFLEGKAPNTQELIRKALDKQYRFDGTVMTVRERIESLRESDELVTDSFEEPKIKPMSRVQFNRASQREQDAHEKKMREAGTKTVYTVSGSELGKYAYDYAQHLLTRGTTGEVKAEIRSDLDAAAHEAATSPLNDTPQPTDGQKSAGNYKVGRVRVQGMDISIENPKGSVRSGTSPDGRKWESTLRAHYGYFTGTKAADGDHLDVYLTDGAEDAPMVWVIDQKNADGTFDEHKTLLGPRTEEEAKAAYLANYEPGWDGIGAISSMPIEAFKAWAFDGKKKRKPLAYVVPEVIATVESSPGSDAGNGFKHGPQAGERYRVGQVSSVGGAIALEKRLPAGTDATFYVGVDGILIDGDSLNLISNESRDRLWIPANSEQASQALHILDEMGRLALSDPRRAEMKRQLKSLVTNSAQPTQVPGESDPREAYADEKANAYIAKRGGSAPPKAVEMVRIGARKEFDKGQDSGPTSKYASGDRVVPSLDVMEGDIVTTPDGKTWMAKVKRGNSIPVVPFENGKPIVSADTARRFDLNETVVTHSGANFYGYGNQPRPASADQPTHQDPGQPAEAVTPAVVAKSIQKSARNTEFNPAEAKKWLIGEIDRAILNVPAENAELAAELAREKAKSFDMQAAEKKYGRDSKAASSARESFNSLRDSNIAKTAKQIGFVTFDVPGDGKFKVMNTVDGLNAFRSKVEKSSGFKAPASKPPVMERETDTGSYTPRDALAAGEYLNAYELARLQGKPLRFGVGNNDTKAYTDASDVEGLIPGFKTFVGRRADGSKMPWAVIEESTGLSFGDGGTSKAAAIASAKAKMKGYEQKIVDMLKRGGISAAKSQQQLETDWIKWAEAKEGRKLEDPDDYASSNQEPIKNETPANTGDSADSDAGNQEPIKNAEPSPLNFTSKQKEIPAYRQTFEQWLDRKWSSSRYRDAYLDNADGDERKAKYAAASGGGETEASARNAYWSALMDSPRDADVSLGMYDSLSDAQKRDVSRHFFKMDGAVSERLAKQAEQSSAEQDRIERETIAPMQAELDRLHATNERTKSGTDAWNQRAKEAGLLEYLIAQLRAGRVSVEDLPARWQGDAAHSSDLASIFTGLSSRGLAKSRAKKAAEAHPRAEQIAYVQDNFLDILTELEDSGIVKINCD